MRYRTQQKKPEVAVYPAQGQQNPKNPYDKLSVVQRHATQVALTAQALIEPYKKPPMEFTKHDIEEAGIKMEQLITEPQLRKILQVSESTLYRLRMEKRISYFLLRMSARKKVIRYKLSDVMTYLNSIKISAIYPSDIPSNNAGPTGKSNDTAIEGNVIERSHGGGVQ